MVTVEEIMDAVGYPGRMRFLQAIRENPGIGYRAARAITGMRSDTFAKNLSRLREAGLITNNGRGFYLTARGEAVMYGVYKAADQ